MQWSLVRSAAMAAVGIFTLLLSVPLLVGQTPIGSISGVVRDGSGAVVPGATVIVTRAGLKNGSWQPEGKKEGCKAEVVRQTKGDLAI